MLVRLTSGWKQSKQESSRNTAARHNQLDINKLMENVYYLNIMNLLKTVSTDTFIDTFDIIIL